MNGLSPEEDKYYYLWVNRGKKSSRFVWIISFLFQPFGWYYIGRFKKGLLISILLSISLHLIDSNQGATYYFLSLIFTGIYATYGSQFASNYIKIQQKKTSLGREPVIERVVVEPKEKKGLMRKCPYCNGKLSELNFFKLKSGNDTPCEYCGEIISP